MADIFSELKEQFKCLSNQIQKGREETMRGFSGINSQLHIIQERLSRLENHVKKVDVIGGFTATSQSTRKILLDDLHKETIRENLEYMVQNFNPTNTQLLDDLVGEDCLSSDEAASVRNQSRKKDKVRKLMCIVGTKDCEKFKTFLSLLENDNSFIASRLRKDFEERSKNTILQKKCIKCTIKGAVDLKDVVDKLCQNKLIDLNFMNLVLSSHLTHDQSELWDALFYRLDSSTDRRYFIKIFQEALAVKHEQIAASFNITLPRTFHCLCNKIISTLPNSQRSSSGSTGDISTTETHREVYLENASPRPVSDDTFSVSDTHSNDVLENIPKTAEWIVKAPFANASENPDPNACSPSTASSSMSFKLPQSPLIFRQNMRGKLYEALSMMTGKTEISPEEKKIADTVNLKTNVYYTSPKKQFKLEKITLAGSSEMFAGKQKHSGSTITQSECEMSNDLIKLNTRKRKIKKEESGTNLRRKVVKKHPFLFKIKMSTSEKKSRKERERNKPKANSSKETPILDHKNYTYLDKTEVEEKTIISVENADF